MTQQFNSCQERGLHGASYSDANLVTYSYTNSYTYAITRPECSVSS